MQDMALDDLSAQVARLSAEVETEGAAILSGWRGWIKDADFVPSAANLANYLALRHRDLREMQQDLMVAGLSSLGRSESRVKPSLEALRHMLALACGGPVAAGPVSPDAFFEGQNLIKARADALLGKSTSEGPVRLMVTLPSEAAVNPDFLVRLARLGVEAVRINCAHDGEAAWAAMIRHVDEAAVETGRRMKVLMDLPGPKIRTGAVREGKDGERVRPGQHLAIARPGMLSDAPRALAGLECTLESAVSETRAGHHVCIDDGKLTTTVLSAEKWGLLVRVDAGPDDKGYRLKPEKGINFPDVYLDVPALTEEDRAILRFAARHADGIEYSFVQSVKDVADLQEALAALRPDDWQDLGLVLKVETRRAVQNLPDMIVRAAGHQPTAVMIARGDLAVEIGFGRVAEMQEEILWLCEAAHVPVIWATQVMEGFLKTGVASRGEMTDAAMAARAECVMLNKGPHLFEGIAMLDRLLDRMSGHISKKAHLLRRLQSW